MKVCYGCDHRHVGCHAHCLAYIDEKEKIEAARAAKLKEKMVTADYREFRRSGWEKVRKHRGRK